MNNHHVAEQQLGQNKTMALYSVQDLFLPFLILLLPLFPILVFFLFPRRTASNPLLPTEWPVVGMLPSLITNLHGFHDYAASLMSAAGGSFEARGPPVTCLRYLCTCDPANARHIFISSFANYPKGEEFASMFDAMGGSFFNADGESWRRQRARAQEITSSPRLAAAMARFCRDKVETGLLPLLRHMAAAPFDLHDVFTRLAFDMTTTAVFGVDPGRLCIDMPPTQFSDAMDTVMEVAFFRHTVPASCWRLMRWLNIGPERKLAAAQPVLRRFVAEMIEKRRCGGGGGGVEQNGAPVDIVSGYMNDPEYVDEDEKPRGFLYDTLITYMFAGSDTVSLSLSWLLYNLIRHPDAVSAIRGELAPLAARKATTDGGMVVFDPEETKPLVYLHAALFESMRLYPPAPIELKEALADDVLPSGHKVRAGDKILVGLYAMGRMEGVWGEDCREYRPERWVTQGGGGALRHVPAHKFLLFNAGPRSCLGKNVSVAQMKCVAAAVVWNFDFKEVEGHAVEQKLSVMLQMNGLMVKAEKRDVAGGE